ncbi:unnamed protein product [Rotaria socialis]|uniref:B30.2/SPRY domain-containing protein n=1 Tax=Rotaria socialis TaxID=392032 RepID=A0A817XY14_9BILA|nr:unnamed protein product [Rotaria socialis]
MIKKSFLKVLSSYSIILVTKYINYSSKTIDTDGLACQSQDQRIWNGARSTKGVKGKGRYYFEITQTDPNGIARVGWSVPIAIIDLGTDNQGFVYGGTGKKSFAKQFDGYDETFGVNDTIGSFIDLDRMKIRFFKNASFKYHLFI